ncbi:hypothetical protein BGX30_014886 [Mortierella sp. GBA39]|nr:hypothetical protein BGX30_014886 [Mortierella sp. GBA39]
MSKVKNRSLKLAQNATLNKAVGVIIQSCGIKGRWREGDNRVHPLFLAGDGNFTSKPGRPIRYFQFFKKLKTKSWVFVIVSADEYFTSKYCCQYHTNSEDHITMDRRFIQCTQCDRARDRDLNRGAQYGSCSIIMDDRLFLASRAVSSHPHHHSLNLNNYVTHQAPPVGAAHC